MKASGFVAGLLLAACHQGLEGPQPVVSALSPSLVCSEQVATVVTVRGEGLSPLHEGNLVASKLTLPSLSLERVLDLDGNEAQGRVDIPDGIRTPNVKWKSLEEMTFSVCPPGTCSQESEALVDYDLPPGLYSVGLKNPNGASAEFPSSLLAVPPPVVERVEPDLLGVSGGQSVTVTGEWFIRIGEDNGTLKVDGKLVPIASLEDCRTLPAVRGLTVDACRAATVEIPSGVFAAGTFDVAVVGPGPNACQSRVKEGRVTLTFVGDPRVSSLEPDLVCTAEGGRVMSIVGEDFLVLGGAKPSVVVGDVEIPALTADGCEEVTGVQLQTSAQQCTRLTFSLEEGSLPPGVHSVGVRHPAPAQGLSASTIPLLVVPPPTVLSLSSEALCTAQGERVLELVGEGFIFIDGETPLSPAVTLSDEGWPMAMVAAEAVPESCRALEDTVSGARVCTRATVTLDKNTVGIGTFALSVTNPEPVGCTSTTAPALLIVPPPTALAFSPATICNSADGASSVVLNGSHFTVVGGQSPSLRILDEHGGNPTVVPTVASNCLEVGREGLPVSTTESVLECATLSAQIPASVLTGANTYATTVLGIEGVGCEAEPIALQTAEGPTLARVDSAKLCVGGGQLVVDGVNLTSSVVFSLVAPGGSPAFPAESAVMSNCSGGRCTRATIDFGLTPAGDFGVQAALAGQCSSVLTQPVRVSRGPLTFGVDPPAMHTDYGTSVSVYVANTDDQQISSVTFFPEGEDPVTSPSAMRFTGSDLDLTRAGRAVVRLPSGLAVGSWSAMVELSGGCGQSILRGAMEVVKALTPGLTLQVLPSYGYVNEDVPVTITSTVALDSIPILYLSNANAPSATGLVGASLQSPTTIAAVVPAGQLQAGQRYDLLLVGSSNGQRVVSIAPNIWKANARPAPTITSVTPESLPTGTDDVTVYGTNFQTTTTLQLACFDNEGRSVASPTFTSGPRYVSPTELFFAATFSSTQALCDVIVTNDDGSTFRYSSIVVSNPAQKLGPFGQTSTLHLPRRALGATVARANVTSRFLYAIGGDAGIEATATRIVEMASIDAFGRLGQFKALPPTARGSAGRVVGPSLALNKPHTYTQAVTIGRWLWVVGGSDGTGAITDVERAFVLDPLNVVKMTDVDISLDPTNGLGGGSWLYRVSPVMGPDDPYNPGGELLASEPITVRLPSVIEGGVAVTIRWEQFLSAGVPAAKYNIYRTPNQQRLGEDDVVWVGQVGGDFLEFTDRGGFPAKPFAHPLPVGSTGVWQTTAPDKTGAAKVNLAMSTPRSGAGVAVMRDPVVRVPGRDVYYLYAVAGNTGTETAVTLDHGTEYMVVEIDRDTQLAHVSGFKAGPQVKLGQTSRGRWQASAFAGSPDSIPYNANRGYLYFASGLRSTAMAENIDYSHLFAPITFGSGSTPAGQPGNWNEANSSGFGGQAGYAGVFVNGFAYCIGGLASVGILDSCYQSQNQTTTSTTTGSMSNPSSCSVSLNQKRMLSASATASGYLFILGGTTSQAPAMGAAMTTVERAIY